MQFTDLEEIEFWCDINDPSTIFAEYVVPSDDDKLPDIPKFISINNPEFESYLRMIVIPKLNGKKRARDIVQDIVDYCAVYGNTDTIEPKTRIAGKLNRGIIEYALNDRSNRCVRVTADGWSITNSPQHKFVKSGSALAQIEPRESQSNLFAILRNFINTDKNGLILLAVWLVQSFCEGSRSMLLIMAQRGSGKSSVTRYIRKILDPSRLEASTFPGKTDELITTLTNSYFVAFDNCDNEISKEQSNLLCCAITGATVPKREYYTTNSLAVFKLHCAIVMNGISILPNESDLAERCLLLNLKPISEKKRRTDSSIEAEFTKLLPELLGCVFDTLSRAMSIIETLEIKELPRMAESYFEMVAIAVALGISQEEFREIYMQNTEAINKARASTDLFEAVREYMTKHVPGRSAEGTVTEIYNKIRNNFSGNKNNLPKSASHFSQKMMAERQTFYTAGFVVNIDSTYADGTHIKIIKK